MNLSRWADSRERQTMVQTLMALLADEKREIAPEERLLILNALFWPGPGEGADDGPPASIAEFAERMMPKPRV